MNAGLDALVPVVGVAAACDALGVPRSRYYRERTPRRVLHPRRRPRSPRALGQEERATVLATLDSDRFMDKVPVQVYAELLDDGEYLCSVRTMYRILATAGQVRERRDQCRHPTYVKPELVATAPNQVWSWDITKLPGPRRGAYYSLYVILDIFSRYVVGWTVGPSESARVAKALIEETCEREAVQPGQLIVHADRGVAMTARSTVMLYADLGIIASYSRPRVSDDNPYSEAAFRTLLYRPEMPDRFGSIEDARAHCGRLFDWYNNRHYHSSLALLTPADVHTRRVEAIVAARQAALDIAYSRHPERFVRRPPAHPLPPPAAWINPPPNTLLLEEARQ